MADARALPRVVIAGLGGGSGKTLVSLALLEAARAAGVPVRAFKKGPDYIDAHWLGWASNAPAHNLDTYMMGVETVQAAFAERACLEGLNVIEGNRGLFDGMDVEGTHSTAVLAHALEAPVILVLNVTKTTRTAAALVLGCQQLDPGMKLAGVILNFVNGRRHEQIVRASLEKICGLPVVGVVPRLEIGDLLPERHLGLVTPEDFLRRDEFRDRLTNAVAPGLDLPQILAIARSAAPFIAPVAPPCTKPDGSGLTIGYVQDAAFSFYYAENLDALAATGAQLVPISSMRSRGLPPELSALYIGGGFPEVHAPAIAANESFLASLRSAASAGLPIYAECGGLILLSRAILWKGQAFAMAGVLPFDCQMSEAAQGHGYVDLLVDGANPFFDIGTVILGHEFHYSAPVFAGPLPQTACSVRRGKGMGQGRDAVAAGNVWASYTHLHALATPAWVAGMIRAARRFSQTPSGDGVVKPNQQQLRGGPKS